MIYRSKINFLFFVKKKIDIICLQSTKIGQLTANYSEKHSIILPPISCINGISLSTLHVCEGQQTQLG